MKVRHRKTVTLGLLLRPGARYQFSSALYAVGVGKSPSWVWMSARGKHAKRPPRQRPQASDDARLWAWVLRTHHQWVPDEAWRQAHRKHEKKQRRFR